MIILFYLLSIHTKVIFRDGESELLQVIDHSKVEQRLDLIGKNDLMNFLFFNLGRIFLISIDNFLLDNIRQPPFLLMLYRLRTFLPSTHLLHHPIPPTFLGNTFLIYVTQKS